MKKKQKQTGPFPTTPSKALPMSKEDLLARANHYYASLKHLQGQDLSYTAPEALPRIQSTQVTALLFTIHDLLVEAGVLSIDKPEQLLIKTKHTPDQKSKARKG